MTASEGSVLAEIDRWEVDFAAAAVLGSDRGRICHGDTRRRVPIASLTKLATALAVMVAVEEAAIDLDDPAGPDGSSVADLLCHASGLPFEGLEPIAAPRTRRIYSNTGYETLAAQLERQVGMSFGQYLHEAVLSPLGMDQTRLVGTAAAGLESNLDDVVKLVGELRWPTLIHPSTADAMRSVRYPELSGVVPGWGQHDPCPWGMGPEIRGTKSPHWAGSTTSPATYGHFGGAGSFAWTDPSVGLSCVAITDRPFGPWATEVWPGFSDSVRAAYS